MILTVKSINLRYSPIFGYSEWTATFNEITRQFEGNGGVARNDNGTVKYVIPYSNVNFCDTYVYDGRMPHIVKPENYELFRRADTKGIKVYPAPELCEFEGREIIAFGHWLSSDKKSNQWHIRNLNKIRETGVLIVEYRDMIPHLVGKNGIKARQIETLLGMKRNSLQVIHISDMENEIIGFQKDGGQLTVDDSAKQK